MFFLVVHFTLHTWSYKYKYTIGRHSMNYALGRNKSFNHYKSYKKYSWKHRTNGKSRKRAVRYRRWSSFFLFCAVNKMNTAKKDWKRTEKTERKKKKIAVTKLWKNYEVRRKFWKKARMCLIHWYLDRIYSSSEMPLKFTDISRISHIQYDKFLEIFWSIWFNLTVLFSWF